VLVVWKLDRLSRSLRDVLPIMERLGDSGAGFRRRRVWIPLAAKDASVDAAQS
jgi:hypothetical protein